MVTTENDQQSIEEFLKDQNPTTFFLLNYAVRRVLMTTNCLNKNFNPNFQTTLKSFILSYM